MSVEDIEVYRELQKHMDQMPIGFPPTKTGVEIRLLQRLFTPQEAEIATKLSYAVEPKDTVEDIYARVKESIGISMEELEQILDNMVKKGTLYFKKKDDKNYYCNALFAVGIFEYQVNKLSKGFVKDFFQFAMEGYAQELFRTKIPQLRTIPIGQSITPEKKVASYDDIRTTLEEMEGPITVVNCICRQMMGLVGRPCKVTSRQETCFTFGDMAQLYSDQGWGRQVSKKEALQIIEKNEEDGLVLQPSNSTQLDFMCSCCGCCCGLLVAKKIFPHPGELFATNYFAVIDPDSCTGCGTCMDRCQMDALTLVDDVSTVNLDRCIGCGLCVPVCPSEAITLENKEIETIPPVNTEVLYAEIGEKRKVLVQQELEKKERRRKRKEERRKKAAKN